MTREKCKEILPVIESFANGEHIEYLDALQIVGTFQRGMWKTANNIGFGSSISNYRRISMREIHYFDGISDTLNKYIK